MDEAEQKALAAQLRQPEGADGIEVGLRLNDTNDEIIGNAFDALSVEVGQSVLELGPGNGAHIPRLVATAKPSRFVCLDISETMMTEARKLDTAESLTEMDFIVYDGMSMPLEDNSFDRIMSANNVYFWEKPVELLNEIHRVLTPGGKVVIAFIQKSSFEQRSFTQFGFNLFDTDKMTQLFADSNFDSVAISDLTDTVIMPDGEQQTRNYSLASAVKA